MKYEGMTEEYKIINPRFIMPFGGDVEIREILSEELNKDDEYEGIKEYIIYWNGKYMSLCSRSLNEVISMAFSCQWAINNYLVNGKE